MCAKRVSPTCIWYWIVCKRKITATAWWRKCDLTYVNKSINTVIRTDEYGIEHIVLWWCIFRDLNDLIEDILSCTKVLVICTPIYDGPSSLNFCALRTENKLCVLIVDADQSTRIGVDIWWISSHTWRVIRVTSFYRNATFWPSDV